MTDNSYAMASRGKLYVISAPSGAGKTSLVKALLDKRGDISVAVSHTTRSRRASETDGINYHFVSTAEFEELVEENAFIEHAMVFGNHYGTSKAEIEKQLSQGQHIILEIDWQGAAQIRKKIPECVSIFILPPSLNTLHTRLQDRGLDDESVISQRMDEAITEISHYGDFDFLLVNDNFEETLKDLINIVDTQPKHLTLDFQSIKLKTLLKELVLSA